MAASSSSISNTNVTLLVEVPNSYINNERFSLECGSVSATYRGFVPAAEQFNFAQPTSSYNLEKNKFSPYAGDKETCFAYLSINSSSLKHPRLESLRIVMCARLIIGHGHNSDLLTKTIIFPPEKLGLMRLTFIAPEDNFEKWDFLIGKDNHEAPDRSIVSMRKLQRIFKKTPWLLSPNLESKLPAFSLEFKINETDYLDPDLTLHLLVSPFFKESPSKDYSLSENHSINLKGKRYFYYPSDRTQQVVALIRVSSSVFLEQLQHVDLIFNATRNTASLGPKKAFEINTIRRIHPSNLTHICVDLKNESDLPSFCLAPPHDLDFMPLPPPSLQQALSATTNQ